MNVIKVCSCENMEKGKNDDLKGHKGVLSSREEEEREVLMNLSEKTDRRLSLWR